VNNEQLALALGIIGTLCWGICFWWMRSISHRQESLLTELHEQGRRIEKLSKAEHDLIREVHPKVEEISEDVGRVAAAVSQTPAQRR
jgi:hypothetical protein